MKDVFRILDDFSEKESTVDHLLIGRLATTTSFKRSKCLPSFKLSPFSLP